ncbi:unnamed protein product [Lampetra fluviatilis]
MPLANRRAGCLRAASERKWSDAIPVPPVSARAGGECGEREREGRGGGGGEEEEGEEGLENEKPRSLCCREASPPHEDAVGGGSAPRSRSSLPRGVASCPDCETLRESYVSERLLHAYKYCTAVFVSYLRLLHVTCEATAPGDGGGGAAVAGERAGQGRGNAAHGGSAMITERQARPTDGKAASTSRKDPTEETEQRRTEGPSGPPVGRGACSEEHRRGARADKCAEKCAETHAGHHIQRRNAEHVG